VSRTLVVDVIIFMGGSSVTVFVVPVDMVVVDRRLLFRRCRCCCCCGSMVDILDLMTMIDYARRSPCIAADAASYSLLSVWMEWTAQSTYLCPDFPASLFFDILAVTLWCEQK
jgi:hypothetical protein